MPLLEVVQLEAWYGSTQVLFGLTFALETGGVTTLLGANGAGKTTTLRAICQTVRTRGAIHLLGQRIDGQATEELVRKGIGHVPEGRGTFNSLSVEENLRLGAHTRSDRHQVAADMDALLLRFPRLRERLKQQAGTLSGGEQQMLALGRALMLRPKLLLLDEPSFGLAPLLVAEIFDILRTIKAEDRMSILIVEQNAALALALADQAHVLEAGKLVLSGPASDLGSDAAVRRAYLGG